VVSPGDLVKAAVAQSNLRQHNLESIDRLLSLDKAQKLLQSVGVDPQLVKAAVPALGDKELARLAAMSEKAQADLVAGFSDRDLLIILVCIVALILVVVAVR
jgi:hypothetical protein